MTQVYSKDTVSGHNKPENLWVVIDEDVFDLSKFQDEHPGQFYRLCNIYIYIYAVS